VITGNYGDREVEYTHREEEAEVVCEHMPTFVKASQWLQTYKYFYSVSLSQCTVDVETYMSPMHDSLFRKAILK
jgi:hypothetical protein